VLPEKQANPQKTFERPPEKKRHRKTEGRSHNLIYEQLPFFRTRLKTPPCFWKTRLRKAERFPRPTGAARKIWSKTKAEPTPNASRAKSA